MLRFLAGARRLPTFGLLFSFFFLAPAIRGAELPTAETILEIHRANRQKLSSLHLMLVHVEETTEAHCRQAQREADEYEKVMQAILAVKPEEFSIAIDGKQVRGAEAAYVREYLTGKGRRKEIENLRRQTKPWHYVYPMEYFSHGENYQVRQPERFLPIDAPLDSWTFPTGPLTEESLLTTYAETAIYSRSHLTAPAARKWQSHGYSTITKKHFADMCSLKLPPFTDGMQPRWDQRHPIDAFFSQPAEKYRVVRQETVDGKLLTVADVAVPISPASDSWHSYRAWLDLSQGALPIKMHFSYTVVEQTSGGWDRSLPHQVITTHEVRTLPDGGFYPAKTVIEDWREDAAQTALTKDEWDEVFAGKRADPRVVTRRNTWDCSLVEVLPNLTDEFFVLPFPAGQKLYDHDTEKLVGALEPKPLVKIGQMAPPLTIARWLDGKARSLEDLRGRVVVLDFWGLWCGACKSSVPMLKSLQERFPDQPVTFVSVHTGEPDVDALAKRITEFKQANGWNYLGAIDSGTMAENSITANAYGIKAFPCPVIIGPDGTVAFVVPDLEGPNCDEEDPKLLADFEAKCDTMWKTWFNVAGEQWPLSDTLSEDEQTAIFDRVMTAYLAEQIETACDGAATKRR